MHSFMQACFLKLSRHMFSLRAFCKLKTVYVYILLTIIDRQFHKKNEKRTQKTFYCRWNCYWLWCDTCNRPWRCCQSFASRVIKFLICTFMQYTFLKMFPIGFTVGYQIISVLKFLWREIHIFSYPGSQIILFKSLYLDERIHLDCFIRVQNSR